MASMAFCRAPLPVQEIRSSSAVSPCCRLDTLMLPAPVMDGGGGGSDPNDVFAEALLPLPGLMLPPAAFGLGLDLSSTLEDAARRSTGERGLCCWDLNMVVVSEKTEKVNL